MIIGVPKEIKDHEYRVALTPRGAARLVHEGHRVLVQSSAGASSGFADREYQAAGAVLLDTPAQLFAQAQLVVKVKEPLGPELDLLRPGLTLFTYLHLAAAPEAAHALLKHKVTGIAYETVELPGGDLPLLTPMSEVAGRLAVQIGAHYLEKAQGGAGVLLGGVPGVLPGRVVVLGAGTVGSHAAAVALGMGATVTLINRGVASLRRLSQVLHGSLETLVATPEAIGPAVKSADLVVGAVLVPGCRAPVLVTRQMVKAMRPGSVIVDVSVDQGGCVETARPTSHSNPVYVAEGVIHYCVPNMPGAVPRTSTQALCNATLPYIANMARYGVAESLRWDPALAKGLNTWDGSLTHRMAAEALGLPAISLEQALSDRA
ncbi:MAG: alanine dehydrogenase [SAR202 cluster bacterium]|nr:alanine dehydrogenase [SAR202 cluster bacterium]